MYRTLKTTDCTSKLPAPTPAPAAHLNHGTLIRMHFKTRPHFDPNVIEFSKHSVDVLCENWLFEWLLDAREADSDHLPIDWIRRKWLKDAMRIEISAIGKFHQNKSQRNEWKGFEAIVIGFLKISSAAVSWENCVYVKAEKQAADVGWFKKRPEQMKSLEE